IMKKSVMILMLTGLLWACSSNASSDGGAVADPEDPAHGHETALTLNNGQKWNADAATGENVTAIHVLAGNFAAEPHTGLSDYGVLASDLQKGLDRMIQECKMSGPDHDALHLWLEPLLRDVNELKKADDPVSAQKIMHAINERLDLYTQYFEQ
ncbi:hypothetical protein, partial [Agriterribacter sp.]|uniref:hypothetical protein n=1 Tax=Agriterribacter sp. TaxID=2821509 RepID=UPI002C53EF48